MGPIFRDFAIVVRCHWCEAAPLLRPLRRGSFLPLQRQTQAFKSEYISGKAPDDRARRLAWAPCYSVYGFGVLLRSGSHRRQIRSVIFGSRMKKPASLFIYLFIYLLWFFYKFIFYLLFYFSTLIPLAHLQLAPRFWFLVNYMPKSWHHAQ